MQCILLYVNKKMPRLADFFGSSGFCILPCLLGALPPSPRHLTLWANSMKRGARRLLRGINAASTLYALLRRREPVEGALPASTPPPGVSPRCGRAAVQWHGRCPRSRRPRLAPIMLLAESAKCRGLGGRAPVPCVLLARKYAKTG